MTDRERVEKILKKKKYSALNSWLNEPIRHLIIDAMLEFHNKGLIDELTDEEINESTRIIGAEYMMILAELVAFQRGAKWYRDKMKGK